jgi:uncharacterized protein
VAARLNDLTVVFVSIVLQSLPFVLAGVFASAVVRQRLREDVVARWMPRRPVPAVLIGALFGLIVPVCDCGAVPLGRRLMAKGVPAYAAIAFLLAAPVINPLTLVSTAIAFQGNVLIVALRAGMTMSVAITVGLLAARLLSQSSRGMPTLSEPLTDGASSGFRTLVGDATADYLDVLFFVVLGALFTAASQTLIPRAEAAALGGQAAGSVLALMPVATILSICSEADAFVARAFASNFSIGAVLAFMTIGQIVDLRNSFLFWRTLGGRLMLLIVFSSYPLVFLEGFVLNRLLAAA